MKKNTIIIKGNKYGIMVMLDPNEDYEEIKLQLAEKVKDASKFFDNAKMAISFEGRVLTGEQQKELVDIITQNSTMNIICIMDNDQKKEEAFKKTLERKLEELSFHTGQFYKGTLRSGQLLEVENSVIVIGDVNPGAKVISKGNILIIGALKGNAYAGAAGNESSFVVALDMSPMQIRIGDIIARSPDQPVKEMQKEAKIAFVEGGSIYIEPINKNVLNDINF